MRCLWLIHFRPHPCTSNVASRYWSLESVIFIQGNGQYFQYMYLKYVFQTQNNILQFCILLLWWKCLDILYQNTCCRDLLFRNRWLDVGSLDDTKGFNALIYFSYYFSQPLIVCILDRFFFSVSLMLFQLCCNTGTGWFFFSSSQKMSRCLEKATHPKDGFEALRTHGRTCISCSIATFPYLLDF